MKMKSHFPVLEQWWLWLGKYQIHMRYSSLMLQLYKVKRLGNYKMDIKLAIKIKLYIKISSCMYIFLAGSRLRQASIKSLLQHKLIPHEGHHQKLIMNIAAEAAELSSSWHGFVSKLWQTLQMNLCLSNDTFNNLMF